MSKHRQAAKVDANQSEIVAALRKAGYSVEVGHDDILVGYQGKTYWYEIKDPEKLFRNDGTFRAGQIKDSQYKLQGEFKGHYKIVWNVDMIFNDIAGKA